MSQQLLLLQSTPAAATRVGDNCYKRRRRLLQTERRHVYNPGMAVLHVMGRGATGVGGGSFNVERRS
jgi:hypothetical protein